MGGKEGKGRGMGVQNIHLEGFVLHRKKVYGFSLMQKHPKYYPCILSIG